MSSAFRRTPRPTGDVFAAILAGCGESAKYGRRFAAPPVDVGVARLAERQHGVVSLAQLRELGLSSRAVHSRAATGRLHRIHRGVYAVGHRALPGYGQWMAAVLACGPHALLSHQSAAALLGLRQTARTRVDVSLPSPSKRERPGIDFHRSATLTAGDRTVCERIPVTTVPRTLLDLAEVVPPRQLQRAYEAAERLELLDLRAIERLLARSNGRQGVRAVRALLAYEPTPAARARSELERMFLDLIREAGLPVPLVNTLVEGFEVDAYWPAARLAVELDGYAYHRARRSFERDRAKQVKLRLAGYDVLALTHRQVTEQPAWVLDAVGRLLGRAMPTASL